MNVNGQPSDNYHTKYRDIHISVDALFSADYEARKGILRVELETQQPR